MLASEGAFRFAGPFDKAFGQADRGNFFLDWKKGRGSGAGVDRQRAERNGKLAECFHFFS